MTPCHSADFKIFNTGLEVGYDMPAYTVTIGPFLVADTNKHICIDSSWFRPGGDWLWASDLGDYPVGWSGQECYAIVVPPDQPPVIETGCPRQPDRPVSHLHVGFG